MAWRIELRPEAEKTIAKLDKPIKKRIAAAIDEIEACDNPRLLLAPYTGPLAGLWKKRVGDYRIVCEIQDRTITVMILEIGHRSKIYR